MRLITFKREETYEQWRQRLLDETSRFIEHGLAHPELVPRIPTHPVNAGAFPRRILQTFWASVLDSD